MRSLGRGGRILGAGSEEEEVPESTRQHKLNCEEVRRHREGHRRWQEQYKQRNVLERVELRAWICTISFTRLG